MSRSSSPFSFLMSREESSEELLYSIFLFTTPRLPQSSNTNVFQLTPCSQASLFTITLRRKSLLVVRGTGRVYVICYMLYLLRTLRSYIHLCTLVCHLSVRKLASNLSNAPNIKIYFTFMPTFSIFRIIANVSMYTYDMNCEIHTQQNTELGEVPHTESLKESNQLTKLIHLNNLLI